MFPPKRYLILSPAAGAFKSKKRERSANFTQLEVRLLSQLAGRYRSILENKRTDTISNRQKDAAWEKITYVFNATSGEITRTTKNLKLKYDALKKFTRKKTTLQRQQLLNRTVAEKHHFELTEEEKHLLANIEVEETRIDCDSITEVSPLSIFDEDKIKLLNEDGINKATNFGNLKNSHVAVGSPLLIFDKNIVKSVNINDDVSEDVEYDEVSFDPLFILDKNDIKSIGEFEIGEATDKIETDESTIVETIRDERPVSSLGSNSNSSADKEGGGDDNVHSTMSHTAPTVRVIPFLNRKSTKIRVTKQLYQLRQARLDLLRVRKLIAEQDLKYKKLEHELHIEEHTVKMLHLQNEEKRRQREHNLKIQSFLKD